MFSGGEVGAVTGIVTTAAKNGAKPLPVTTDVQACGKTEVADQSLVVNGGKLANAVVVIEGAKAAGGSGIGILDQKGCAYTPHVQVLTKWDGGKAKAQILNSDPTLHNVHGYKANGQTEFNQAQPAGPAKIMRMLREEGVYSLKCDVHPWMSAYFYVTENLAAVTDAEGRFQIEGVPAGSYTVKVWHETLGTREGKVTVTPGAKAELTLEI